MLSRLDPLVRRWHTRRRPHKAMPPSEELDTAIEALGARAVVEEVRRNGDGADRRLGFFLTAAGFITAFSGHAIGLDVDAGAAQSLLLSGATLAAFLSFLTALRGTTRRIDPPLVLGEPDLELAHREASVLAVKNAYASLSARCLLSAVICVALVNWLDSLSSL
jgi:hypothetical protein